MALIKPSCMIFDSTVITTCVELKHIQCRHSPATHRPVSIVIEEASTMKIAGIVSVSPFLLVLLAL